MCINAKAWLTARYPAKGASEAAGLLENFEKTFVTSRGAAAAARNTHVCHGGVGGRDFVRLKTKTGDGFLKRIVTSVPEASFVIVRRKEPYACLSKGVHYPRV
jgi:hypothetical protein